MKKKQADWRDATLQDLVYFQRGFDISQVEQEAGAIPVISSSGTKSYHSEAKVKSPGVIIGRKGTLGSIYYSRVDYWPHSTTLWSKDLKGNDARFVYYFLHTLKLERLDTGNSNPTLNRNHIHKISIKIPPLPIQQKIADILSKYDDLIENNRRRIELLERSARLLYKEWFVRLRFPGHEHTPIIDGIPEGWEKVKLQSIIKIFHGFAFRSEQFVEQKTNTIVVRMGNFKEEGGLKFEEKDNKYLIENSYNEKYLLKPRDLLMVLSDVTRDGRIIGNVGFVPNDNNLYVLNQRVARIEAPEDLKLYLYCSFGSSLYKNHCLSRANSVTVLNLKNDHIYEYQILIPDHQRLLIFSGIVKSIVNNIHVLEQQNQKLKQARDILLPKLMNGEIEV
jgi:type I restriction enzyme S subunit